MQVLKRPYTTIFVRILNKIFFLLNKSQQFATYSILSNSLRHLGKNVRLDYNVLLIQPENITLKDNIFIGRDTIFHAYDSISIGNHTVIAAGCKLISANHRYEDLNIPINFQGHDCKPILIDDDVWLGYGVIILPGVHLGKGCVVAAGSVVTKSFAPFSVLAGVPAKLIKLRQNNETSI